MKMLEENKIIKMNGMDWKVDGYNKRAEVYGGEQSGQPAVLEWRRIESPAKCFSSEFYGTAEVLEIDCSLQNTYLPINNLATEISSEVMENRTQPPQ